LDWVFPAYVVPFRGVRKAARRTNSATEKETAMKKLKDLRAAIDALQSLADGNDISPEQKSAVTEAIAAVKGIRRKPNPSRQETAKCIRQIVEHLHCAFFRKR
jgi:hypothetical protein